MKISAKIWIEINVHPHNIGIKIMHFQVLSDTIFDLMHVLVLKFKSMKCVGGKNIYVHVCFSKILIVLQVLIACFNGFKHLLGRPQLYIYWKWMLSCRAALWKVETWYISLYFENNEFCWFKDTLKHNHLHRLFRKIH